MFFGVMYVVYALIGVSGWSLCVSGCVSARVVCVYICIQQILL